MMIRPSEDSPCLFRVGLTVCRSLKGNMGTSQYSSIDPNELFSQFFRNFGRGSFGSQFGGDPFGEFVGGGRRPGMGRTFYGTFHRAPQVATVELRCTLEELYMGTTKKMRVSRTNLNAMRAETVVLEIKIKPGWKANTRITFRGEGNEVMPGVFQDITFIIRELKHARFVREGSNLAFRHKIDLEQALTGCSVPVKRLDGKELNVKIDEVIHPNYIKIVPGEGMPSSKRPEHFGKCLSFYVCTYHFYIGTYIKPLAPFLDQPS